VGKSGWLEIGFFGLRLSESYYKSIQYWSWIPILYGFFEKIGMHATLLSQYIQGTKIPSAKQLAKIQEGIHSLGKELQEVNLI
jgi:hypothetical protein